MEAKDTKYHSTGGPLNVERYDYKDKNVGMLVNAFHETGLPFVDFNGDKQIGTMTVQNTAKNGKRVSTYVAFVKPVRYKRKNIVVVTSAQVTRVLIHKKKKIAYGVKYFRQGEWHEVHAKKEVILSAGALGSPKILMLSGVGPKHDLEALKIHVIKDLNVGKNLQDHATTDAMLMKLTNKTSTMIQAHQILSNVRKYSKSKQKYGQLSATGPLQLTAFVRTEYADDDKTVPDIQFHFDGRNYREFYADPTTYLATNKLPFSYYDSINVRPILLLPKSRGYVTLNTTDPIFGLPMIYPRFFTVKKDLDTLVAALKFVIKLEDTEAFRNNGVEFIREPVKACANHKWGTDDYFACLFTRYTTTIFHPSGTCKMGPAKDKDAVVDPRLKVYGIRHLRVADASVMPNIVRGNTNAPVIMIGEKVSDMVKEDWKHLTKGQYLKNSFSEP